MPRQLLLPLPIHADPRYTQDDFREAPSNAAAHAWIVRTQEWPNRRLALWGEAGRGKTHLLHIWTGLTGAALWRGPELTGLPELPTAGIALDEADAVPRETALLHLLNAAGEAGLPLLLAARTPPARWPVHLPDLASRLRAVTAVEIGAPEDTLLLQLAARLFADRRLEPPQDVVNWLLSRLPRSAAALHAAIARLDDASLGAHRKITVPFAAQVLADLLAHDEISATDHHPSRSAGASL